MSDLRDTDPAPRNLLTTNPPISAPPELDLPVNSPQSSRHQAGPSKLDFSNLKENKKPRITWTTWHEAPEGLMAPLPTGSLSALRD